jgi:hypothetical protein
MLTERYLELVKSALVNELYVELEAQLLMSVLCSAQNVVLDLPDFWAVRKDRDFLGQLMAAKQGGETILLETQDAATRSHVDGNLRNYTEFSYTLVGRKRLDHLQQCVEDALDSGVPGDFLEAGVWRGGCCILMRAVLEARNCRDRRVWLADSFTGLPSSERAEDRDYAMDSSRLPVLAVSEEEVRRNFERFDLLDDQLRFLPGWFEETLPGSDTGPLALLRVDCDLYASTLTVLDSLYSRVSPGGWVVIDDYGILPPCKQAVDEFRARHGITAALERIDDHAVCWRAG